MPAVSNAAALSCGVVQHTVISIDTERPVEFVDLTDRLARIVEDAKIADGVLMVQSRHTTASLLVNEHEPLLLTDLEAMFERLAPQSAPYAHDDFARRTVNLTMDERSNGHSHCRAALLRSSEWLPIAGGRLTLGRWQRVLLIDFDGGRRREVWVTLLGHASEQIA
jgi:secondary thiamine-phosphate synthase enzyme